MAELTSKTTATRMCPKCSIPLDPCHGGDVSLDHCSTCQGVWFDEGEVQDFLNTTWPLERYVPYHARNWEKGQSPCPICGKAMLVLPANPTFPFDIDICPADKGHWIDGGEVRQVMAVAKAHTLRLKVPSEEPKEDWRTQRMHERIQAIENRRHEPETHPHPALEAAFQEPDLVTGYSDLSAGQIVLAIIGVPVERDELYRWRSVVNLAIIALTVLVHLQMIRSGHHRQLVMTWGFVPAELARAPRLALMKAVGSTFIHANLAHLLGNMLFLFLVGDDIERRTGHLLFPFFYIACGLAAAGASWLFGEGPNTPHIGASGAVAGVMGAYLVLCYYKHFCFRLYWRLLILPSWAYLLFWIACQTILMGVGGSHIAYAAHVGGFAFGLAGGCAIAALQRFNPRTGEWDWKLLSPTTEKRVR